MYFSDIVKEIGTGSFEFKEKTNPIFKITKPKIAINFYIKKAELVFKGEQEHKIVAEYSDFKKISFKTTKAKDEYSEDTCKLFYDKQEQFELTEKKMQDYKNLFASLAKLFDDNEKCSPYFQVGALIKEFSIKASAEYDAAIYKLLLLYKDRMSVLFEDELLKKNSTILCVLEENSGKIADNMGQTVKKNLSLGGLFSGGLGGLAGKAFSVAKAAGSRLFEGLANEIVGNKSLIILTDKNVIVAKADSMNEHDFADAYDIFQAQSDEVLAGVVDIYDDGGIKILDNISQTEWNKFRTTLRKLKKDSGETQDEEAGFDDDEESDDEEFSEIEAKLEKIKKLVDKGLLSQEDFDKKKAELLANL